MLSNIVQASRRLTKWQWLAIVAMLVVVSVFVDHWWPLYGGPVRGTVIDAATSGPLPDAMVIVKWRGGLGGVHGTRYLCYHVALARSDGEGKVHVPSWFYDVITGSGPRWLTSIDAIGMDKPIEYTAYKRGYLIRQPVYPVAAGKDIVMLMDRFEGAPSERIGQLLKLAHEAVCDADSFAKLPFIQVLYQEAKDLPKTKDDVKFVDGMLVEIESIQYGELEARRREKERDNERCKPERRTETSNGRVSSWLVCTGDGLVGEKR